jgi:hypothetical protein
MKDVKGKLKAFKSQYNQGYFDIVKDGDFLWRDMLDDKGKPLSYKAISEVLEKDNLPFGSYIADELLISDRDMKKLEAIGTLQFQLMDQVNSLTKIALRDKRNRRKFSKFIKGLVYFNAETDDEKKLIKDLILNKESNLVLGRTDIVKGNKISELQISSAGWSVMDRLAEDSELIGEDIVLNLYRTMVKNSDKDIGSNICFLVSEGVSAYWDQFVDMMNILNREYTERVAYISGFDGITFDSSGNCIHTLNNGEKVKIDLIYTISDIRRFLKEGGKHILEGLLTSDTKFFPTFNPLLNNTQIVYALLNYDLTNDWFKYRLGVEKFSLIKSQIVNYDFVAKDSRIELLDANQGVDISMPEFISATSRRIRKNFLIRYLLTNDLSKISGGWGLRKMSNYKISELKKLFQKSFHFIESIKNTGNMDKSGELIAISRKLKSYLDKEINIYKIKEDKIIKDKLKSPLQSKSVFYLRDKKVEVAGLYHYISSQESSDLKVGGDKRTLGGYRLS